jgi:hypothetical protein
MKASIRLIGAVENRVCGPQGRRWREITLTPARNGTPDIQPEGSVSSTWDFTCHTTEIVSLSFLFIEFNNFFIHQEMK